MNRKEAYELVKQYELEDTLKEKYGVNYTNLTTRTLEDEIEEYEDQDERQKMIAIVTKIIRLQLMKKLVLPS